MLFFFSRGIPEHQEKNLSEKGRENSNYISRPLRDLKQGYILNEASALTTALTPGGRSNSKKFRIVVCQSLKS